MSRAPDTRARIEAAALALFAEKGVDGTSTRDIAKAVGVTEGALYRHFASKDELARALFLSRYGGFAAGVQEIRARGQSFPATAAALVRFFYTAFDADADAFAYVLVTQHDHLGGMEADAPENVVAALARTLADAMARGEIAQGDVALVSALALGLVVQPAIFRLYGRLPQPPSAYAEEVTRAVLAAVGARM